MIRFALGHSDKIISVCGALAQEMAAIGIDNGKISIIPNGVDAGRFHLADKKLARGKLSISDESKLLLSVGALIPRKGFHLLLQAFKQLVKQMDGLHLCIIGEGPHRSSLEEQIKIFDLDRYVTLVGECPHEDLPMWYNAADLFCLASSREGWANVIMESLACGTPVVATNVWGAPEILTSHDVGLLVERTPDSIAAGLYDALSKEWDRKRIRAHVAGRTWDAVAREVEQVFLSTVET
jgi:glycosyltransferase involved in cell wall biosynthesis